MGCFFSIPKVPKWWTVHGWVAHIKRYGKWETWNIPRILFQPGPAGMISLCPSYQLPIRDPNTISLSPQLTFRSQTMWFHPVYPPWFLEGQFIFIPWHLKFPMIFPMIYLPLYIYWVISHGNVGSNLSSTEVMYCHIYIYMLQIYAGQPWINKPHLRLFNWEGTI